MDLYLSFTCRSPHHFLNDVLKFALLTPFSFTGWIGASLSRSPGGGSNYLCLPRNPKYSPVVDKSENENRAKLYGVEFQFAENIFKDTVSGEHDYYDAACAACKIRGRDSKIMIPGHIQCPKNWVLEYRGYLMAQETHLPRTEYICVDETPEFINGTERLSQGAGLLHFVETACGALPCRRVGPYYKKHYELSCVVCSSWELQPWDEELVILWFTLFLGRMRTELNSSIAQDLIMPRWINGKSVSRRMLTMHPKEVVMVLLWDTKEQKKKFIPGSRIGSSYWLYWTSWWSHETRAISIMQRSSIIQILRAARILKSIAYGQVKERT